MDAIINGTAEKNLVITIAVNCRKKKLPISFLHFADPISSAVRFLYPIN